MNQKCISSLGRPSLYAKKEGSKKEKKKKKAKAEKMRYQKKRKGEKRTLFKKRKEEGTDDNEESPTRKKPVSHVGRQMTLSSISRGSHHRESELNREGILKRDCHGRRPSKNRLLNLNSQGQKGVDNVLFNPYKIGGICIHYFKVCFFLSLSFPPLPPLRRREEKEEDGGLEEREREKEREDARRDNREMVSIARGKRIREEEEEHKKSFKRVSEREEITVTFWYFFPREVRISFPFSFSRLGRQAFTFA